MEIDNDEDASRVEVRGRRDCEKGLKNPHWDFLELVPK